MTSRTYWICENCGTRLRNESRSQSRTQYVHKKKASYCPGIKPMTLDEYRADLAAIARFLENGLLDRITKGEPKPCNASAHNATERERWAPSTRLLACQIPVIIATEPALSHWHKLSSITTI